MTETNPKNQTDAATERRNFLWLASGVVLGGGLLWTAIFLPGLRRSRGPFPEGNAIWPLWSLVTAQAQFQSQAQVDQNKNGIGEYGLLNELCGASNLRDAQGGCSLPPVIPTFISPMFRVDSSAGYATRYGYRFQVFLPHSQNVVSDQPAPPKGSQDQASILAQETRWIGYAWPVKFGAGGSSRRCFVTDQDGAVLASPNVKPDGTPYYSGSHAPVYNAALDQRSHQDSLHWGKLAWQTGQTPGAQSYAMDGQLWRPVGS